MRWTKIYAKNFLSFEEVELSLDSRGLVLIEGKNETNQAFRSNGSGKTGLVEIITYGIYDTTSKGIKADDVINKATKKNLKVCLEGVKGEDTYRIERYRKYPKIGTTVKLYCNGKDISEKSVKATNEVIEKIVGVDYNTFVNSIMFSQGTGAGRFATATDKEKKEILENLVNLEIYGKAQEVAKERIKEKDEDILAKEREVEKLQWELANVDTLEQQDRDNYESTKKLIKQESDNIKKYVEEMAAYAKKHSNQMEVLREEIAQLHKQIESYNNIDISGVTQQVNDLHNQVQRKEMEVNQLNSKKEELISKYHKIQQDTNCPVCGNLLDPAHREKEMAAIKEELRGVLVNTQTATQEHTSLLEQYNALYGEYLKKKEVYESGNAQYHQLVQNKVAKEGIIKNYEVTIQQYKDKSRYAQDTVNKLLEIPEPKSRDKDRKEINKKIVEVKREIVEITKERNKLEDVVKIFSNSGVKSHVLDLITPFLNERANKYLKVLSGSDIEIEFSTQTTNKSGEKVDKFDVRVMNNVGGETYQANSEGEKKRIDLAISLAIQDLVMSKPNLSTNIVIYDEVFDALDQVGAENVIELLRERLNIVGTIFVITHNDTLKSLFESIITVTKDKRGISRLEEGEAA